MDLALESSTSRLVLDNRRVGIGRLLTNQFVLYDLQVSGLHAEIIPTACGCLLIDLGGKNGTFVNGHRLVPCALYIALRRQNTRWSDGATFLDACYANAALGSQIKAAK